MPTNPPIFRYAVLGFLFVITLAYEVRYTSDVLRDETIDVPFFLPEAASNRIGFVRPAAVSAGLHVGDLLVAVNGTPYTGTGVLGAALAHARPGIPIILAITSSGSTGPAERTVSIPVSQNQPTFWELSGDLALHFLLPAVCLLLGFWVALVRPRDPMAWLLLALMMTFPHLLETHEISGWSPGWRELGMLYHSELGALFPIVIFLFGRFFPEPFPKRSKYDLIWKIQQWVLGLPLFAFGFESVIVAVVQLGNYKSVVALDRAFRPFDHLVSVLVYVLIGSFFAAIGIKGGISKSPDVKRRLRFLYWGATAAFAPGLLMTIYARIAGRSPTEIFPQWPIVLALVLFVLFPLTLAYVIVVQKAMDVGVALRQGLQYALAKNGVRGLQALAITGVLITAVSMGGDATRNRPQKVTVIALGVTAAFTIRRLGERLRTWVDRRFFREAYDAEQILTELSEQVRSIVDPSRLLETVAASISETLHVPQVAVLLSGVECYRPVFALGYGDLPDVIFPGQTGTARVLQQQRGPARVFLTDRDSWLHREEEIGDQERNNLAALGSELLLPLSARDKLLGFISLGPKKSEEPYTSSDVRLLKSVAVQTGLALENAKLIREITDEIAQREWLNREVEIAREVQERLFPQKLPVIAGLDYAGRCRPALWVGGDYYDFLALPEGHLGVAVGDVSGKGIAAALTMASLQASLRGEAARAPGNLAAAVSNINHLLYESSSANRYATFFYGQYDPATGKFDYVNAGHNPPMLFHIADEQWTVTRLEVGGTVVGLLESYPYQQGSIEFTKGDILVAYTDGISEAMNAAHEEWGEDCLEETIQRCNGLQSQEILQSVFTAADKFVAGASQSDDMTLVVLRVIP